MGVVYEYCESCDEIQEVATYWTKDDREASSLCAECEKDLGIES